MAKCELRVPPNNPSEGTKWEREDGVIFIYSNKGWVRNESKN